MYASAATFATVDHSEQATVRRLQAQVARWEKIVAEYEARRFRSQLTGARRCLDAARRALADVQGLQLAEA